MNIWLLVLGILAWLLRGSLDGLRFSSSLSEFELERRILEGDSSARLLRRQNRRVSQLYGLRSFLNSLLLVIMSLCFISSVGLTWGLATLFLAILLQPKLLSLGRFADSFYMRYQAKIFKLVDSGKSFWAWFGKGLDTEKARPKVYSKEELIQIASDNPAVLSPDELSLLKGSINFKNRLVKEVMTPAKNIKSVSASEVLGPLIRDELHRTGFKAFPVIKKDLNHVIGWLKMSDLRLLDNDHQKVEEAISGEVDNLAADDSLADALDACLQTGSHLFIVVNAKRETVGIISLSDIINALFGQK